MTSSLVHVFKTTLPKSLHTRPESEPGAQKDKLLWCPVSFEIWRFMASIWAPCWFTFCEGWRHFFKLNFNVCFIDFIRFLDPYILNRKTMLPVEQPNQDKFKNIGILIGLASSRRPFGIGIPYLFASMFECLFGLPFSFLSLSWSSKLLHQHSATRCGNDLFVS